MRLPNGLLKKLSEKTGMKISVQRLSDHAAGRIRPSRKRAIFLEKCSGVSRVTWIFGSPEEIKAALKNSPRLNESSKHDQTVAVNY